MPALAIPIELARAAGCAVTSVLYPGDPWPDWRRAETGDWGEVTDALAPQIGPAVRGADDVVVIAKSMGTAVFPGVRPLLPPQGRAIWVTPLFGRADVRAAVIESGWRCLSVFGTADSMHDPIAQAAVTAALTGTELGIEGANHALVVEGDDNATQIGLDALRAAVAAFI